MTTNRIVLVNAPPLGPLESPSLKRLEGAGFSLVRNLTGITLTAEEHTKRVRDADAAIGGLEPYTEEILRSAERLKIVARFGVGFDNVDLNCAEELGISVTITPGANSESAADYAMSLIAAASCSLIPHHVEVIGGGWKKSKFPGLFGRTLGIIGFGRIGQAVARRARGFGMTVRAYDPYAPDTEESLDLPTLFEESDVITLHTPPSDKPIIDEAAVARMKAGVIIINSARGELIDEAALAAALVEGHVGGAALDVFVEEPLKETPLREAPNVIFSPHAAGVSDSAIETMAAMCVDAIITHFDGGKIPEAQLVKAC